MGTSSIGPVEIDYLIDEELSAVAFVRDYVEFHFDGPVLTSWADPFVEDGCTIISQFPAPGSRDALCDLIGRMVVDARDEADHLRLHFANSMVLSIPKSSDASGPEVAQLIPRLPAGQSDMRGLRIWENQATAGPL